MAILGHLQCQLSCPEFSLYFQAAKRPRESQSSQKLLLILQLQIEALARTPFCSGLSVMRPAAAMVNQRLSTRSSQARRFLKPRKPEGEQRDPSRASSSLKRA